MPGIDGDRQYAFYRARDASRFPWLTGREVARMVTYSARYLEPDNPRHSALEVAAEGAQQDVRNSRLLNLLGQAAGEEVRLLQRLYACLGSLDLDARSLDERCGRPLDPARFRANIFIETGGLEGGGRLTGSAVRLCSATRKTHPGCGLMCR